MNQNIVEVYEDRVVTKISIYPNQSNPYKKYVIKDGEIDFGNDMIKIFIKGKLLGNVIYLPVSNTVIIYMNRITK